MVEIKKLEINDYTFRLGQRVKNVDLGIEGHIHSIVPQWKEDRVMVYIVGKEGDPVLYKVFQGHPYEVIYGPVEEEGSKNENPVG